MFPLKYYSILRNYFTFSEITGSADGDSAAYVSLSINLNATETATGIIPEYEQSFLTRAWYTALTSLQRGCCSSLLPEEQQEGKVCLWNSEEKRKGGSKRLHKSEKATVTHEIHQFNFWVSLDSFGALLMTCNPSPGSGHLLLALTSDW
ncbi:uncharacterized protein LOC135300335 isoform X4 [Passer domesticus]|uniref:uncharacterized protein LOC135300335 isoform X4 n=1 Tax=Passer domesticus TaxID=48849 RepID=UPI0030FF2015